MNLEPKDIFSISLGAYGAILSTYATIRIVLKDRVKLKIIPKIYGRLPDGARMTLRDDANLNDNWEGLCIEVVNVGSVAASVDQIGLETNDPDLPHMIKTSLQFTDDKIKLPHTLEPKTKLVALWPTPPLAFKLGLYNIKRAYVITSCDKTFTGNSPIIKRLIGMGKRTQFRLQPEVSAPMDNVVRSSNP